MLVEDDFTHRLMGTAGYVGARHLIPLCEKAERMNPGEIDAKKKILSDIEAAFIEVESHFRKEGYI